jgi:hypothetical protein
MVFIYSTCVMPHIALHTHTYVIMNWLFYMVYTEQFPDVMVGFFQVIYDWIQSFLFSHAFIQETAEIALEAV